MIEIIQENCSSKEFYDDLRELVNRYSEEITGSITIKITNIVRDEEDNDIVDQYRVYLRRVDRLKEHSYISEWSKNNGSEIGKLIKVNPIISYLTDSWDYYNRYQSVDLLETFEEYISELFDGVEIVDVLEAIRDNEELEFVNNSWNKKLVEKFEDFNDFKNHFLQTLDVFYSRNPKFRMDW